MPIFLFQAFRGRSIEDLGAMVIVMYCIVPNHIKWHGENLRSDRENTGNFKEHKCKLICCLIR